MPFFWQKQKQVIAEAKGLPDFGKTMVIAGDAPAKWMEASAEAYAREGYQQNPIAFACVNKIAQGLASVDLEVMRYKDDERVEIENHPLYSLIERPNPEQGGAEFFEALASYYLISGDAYVLRLPLGSKRPVELWSLRPDRVKIRVDGRGKTIGYVYKTSINEVFFPVDENGISDVLHLKRFNPLDDNYGLAVMGAAAKSVDIVNEALTWNKKLLQNGARPSGAYVLNTSSGQQTLSDEQFARLREQLQQDTGAHAAGKPLILEGGLEWREMSLSPKDMDFENNMWASARMIATVFGVPPMLVNIPGDSTYNNMSEAKLSLWQETILPLLDRILDAFNNWMAPVYGEDVVVCYNANNITALEEGRFVKLEKLQAITYLTIDEKRKLAGFGNYTGGNGDLLFSDANLVPLDILGEAPPNG